MTLEEARANIGQRVVYTPNDGGHQETGVISSVGQIYVFVRYGDWAKATPPEDLALQDTTR